MSASPARQRPIRAALRRGVVAALIAVTVSLPGTPALAAPAIDCARQPFGVRGCEAYLGALVRREQGLSLPGVSDAQLGRAVRLLCFGSDVEDLQITKSRPSDRELVYNLSRLADAKGGYCG